jgi:FHA domain
MDYDAEEDEFLQQFQNQNALEPALARVQNVNGEYMAKMMKFALLCSEKCSESQKEVEVAPEEEGGVLQPSTVANTHRKAAKISKRGDITQKTKTGPSPEPSEETETIIITDSNTILTESDIAKIPRGTVRIEVVHSMEGHHVGEVFMVKPRIPGHKTAKDHARVGRSISKDCKTYGVSLWEDRSVSTAHGVFYNRGNYYTYTDVKSSNGSFVNGEKLEPNIEKRLENGMEINVGDCYLKVHFNPL